MTAKGLLSPRTARQTRTHPAGLPQDKCIYIFVTKNTTPIRTWPVLLWTSAAWLFWYFNKYQAQTRLGASSLQNVSEGSAITHNKWSYANSGDFAMHKSLFGVHHGDAVCWYAIILKEYQSSGVSLPSCCSSGGMLWAATDYHRNIPWIKRKNLGW